MKTFSILSRAALIVVFAAPAVAEAANAYTTGNVNSRAGPSVNFPRVTTLPAGVTVTIYGCVSDLGWCDTSWRGQRGWVSSRYLEYLYDDRRVLVQDYGRRIGVPIISFQFGNYWDRYYSDRPWYRDRPRWRERWTRNDWNWRDDDDDYRRRSAERTRDDDDSESRRRRVDEHQVFTGSTRRLSSDSERDEPRRRSNERGSSKDVPRGGRKQGGDFCPPGLAKQGRCEQQ